MPNQHTKAKAAGTAPAKKPAPNAKKAKAPAKPEATTPAEPKPPKAPKPPRIPTFIDEPFSETGYVPLSPADFLTKTHVMLRVSREHENLKAEFESVKAQWKQTIKEKQEEIVELNGELQSNSAKREVAYIARYFPKTKVKRIIDAGTKKKVRDEPMTPAEVRKYSEATLFKPAEMASTPPPPTPAPAAPATPAAPPADTTPRKEPTTGQEFTEDDPARTPQGDDENPDGAEEFTPQD